MVFRVMEIKNWDIEKEIDGKWIPARPLPYFGIYGLKMRIRNAWGVFSGRYDALDWGH